MEEREKLMDKKELVEILASVYNSRLQMLLGYRNQRFTKELVNYMFWTFDMLKKTDSYKNFAVDMRSSLSDLFNREYSFRMKNSGMFTIAFNLELYAQALDQESENLPGADELDNYRKRLTKKFSAKVRNTPELFTEYMTKNDDYLNPIIGHQRRAVARRNYLVHGKKHGDTYYYKGYFYLCMYDLLLAYLLYAFYHMAFVSSDLLKYLKLEDDTSMKEEGVSKRYALSPLHKIDDLPLLQLQREWAYIRHIYADYLLKDSVWYLFRDKATNPAYMGHEEYMKLRERVKGEAGGNEQEKIKLAEQQKERLEQIKKKWSSEWAVRLVEYFQLRILGKHSCTEFYDRYKNYCSYFMDILKGLERNPNPINITHDFLQMLGDYLYTVTPGERKDKHPLSMLQQVRMEYKSCRGREDYINFEENLYVAALMEMMEELASDYPNKLGRNPIARHFLSVSEYLMALAVYVYMVELMIHISNMDRGIPSFDFIGYMRNFDCFAL